MPKLFQKFGKLKRTAAINSDGIGLGLTIVKQIVEKIGGQICVESEGLTKGSTFILSMQMEPIYDQNDNISLNLVKGENSPNSVAGPESDASPKSS